MTSLPAPEEQVRRDFEAHLDGRLQVNGGSGSHTEWAWAAWSAAHRLYAPALPEPEPVAWLCEWDRWHQYHDAHDPLPDTWDDDVPKITPLYAAQKETP